MKREQINETSSGKEVQSEAEEHSVKSATRLTARLVYEVVRRDGIEELGRPVTSLVWSGLAAGLLISFSVLGMAIFRQALPDTPWRPAAESVGYSLGFLLVILGRMQLFTENTITTVLPFVGSPTALNLGRVARLWSVVLVANVVGALAAAVFIAHSGALDADIIAIIDDISRHSVLIDAPQAFVRAIPAGVLIAAIVWLLPSSGGNSFLVILTFTWLISAGGFNHVIAESVEAGFLVVTGTMGPGAALFQFFVPVLLGNVVGGTLIFSLMTWGQVHHEVK